MSDRTRLTVQTGWYWDAEFIGYFVAEHLGLYDEHGLDVAFLEGGPEIDPERALLDGVADIAITVRETTVPLVESGADLEVIGVQYRDDPLAVLVPSDGAIGALIDLRGATIAVPDVSRPALVQGLRRAGVPLDEVALIAFDGGAGPLAHGVADAVVGYVTSLPIDLARAGFETRSLLLSPGGEPSAGQNLIVARRSRSSHSPGPFASWLEASAAGWRINAHDPARFPAEFASTWFAGARRPVGDEVTHNARQLEFMGPTDDYLALKGPRTIPTP